ncbi:MAG: hypothetical protein CVU40_09745 [Chloroflexi bacterium HGW-Chloroflexi-2]|jgi:hypothetical protein|nr:MAG: hypothetical protein CVU40_09745 [Chloroflexi bacterium HGW-Chloroflexi-2]
MKCKLAKNLRIFYKFVIDITCVEKFVMPYKHFSTLKKLKLSLSRFFKKENACNNQYTIE